MHCTLALPVRAAPLAVAVFLILVLAARAATPPVNDSCAGAVVIPGNGPFPHFTAPLDISGATTNDEPVLECASNPTNGVWFSFTPTISGLYTISSGADTMTDISDTVMAFYTSAGGCGAPFTSFACNDDESSLRAAISTNLVGGQQYFIVVLVGESVGANGPFHLQLRVTKPARPANDDCLGAEVAPSSGPFPWNSPMIDTTLARNTNTDPASACSGLRGVWFQFTPNASGTYVLTTGSETSTTIEGTSMALFTSAGGCGGAFTEVACHQPGLGRAALTRVLTSGTPYYVLVRDTFPDLMEPSLTYIAAETDLQLRVIAAAAPAVTTLPVTNLTSTSAVFRATVNANGLQSRLWFEWSTNANFTVLSISPTRVFPAGSFPLTTNLFVQGFRAGVTYYYRAVATNILGKTIGATNAFTIVRMTVVSATEPGTPFRFQFIAGQNQAFAVETSTNLTDWSLLGSASHLGGGLFEFSHPNPGTNGSRFYRVRSP